MEGTGSSEAANRVGERLEELYATLSPDEQEVLDFILRQAVARVGEQAEVEGHSMHMAAGTQDAMKRVLFGAAGVSGQLATPGMINSLMASARDANLFS